MCDFVYPDTPPVPNEMLNRHQLTSQGAKARRLLIEALLAEADTPCLGLDAGGFPPERAMYDAVVGASGIHRMRDGVLRIGAPARGRGWDGAWATIARMLGLAQRHRVGIDRILDELAAPPIGLKAGPGPVLVVCAILDNRSEVALYEHGTYRPRLTPDVVERLLRNPNHFEIKHFAAVRGPRRVVVDALAEALGIVNSWRKTAPSVLTVVSHLAATANSLTDYARRTRTLNPPAAAVRRALGDAREPDVLLFETLPAVFGLPPVPARGADPGDAAAYAGYLAGTVSEIAGAHEKLLRHVRQILRAATAASEERTRSELRIRAKILEGKVLDPRLRALCSALTVTGMDDRAWTEYVAMVVTGPPPGSWDDDDRLRFDANMAELGATLRRIESIHFDRRADTVDGAYTPVRVTATRPDGTERARVVAITDQARVALSRPLADLVAAAAELLGSRVRAEEMLAALTAEWLLPAMAPVPGGADSASEGVDTEDRAKPSSVARQLRTSGRE